ncbi:MAG: SRPBCC domain-containing protein [Candidatus Aminicenantes bacterium]|nr:SRPBCC domain-containing protein [Candidatus Aminicenantes bacterium]NLH76195.1 SRPBCC domain-containing protein [Acidobacteriota bacterium]
MPHIEVNRNAPVIGAAEAHIGAPIEVVWRILSDLPGWPEWNKGVSRISVDGPVKVGAEFRWGSGGMKIASRLVDVEPPQRIAWTGKMIGVRAVHVWELTESGAGTHVRTEESFEGWLAKLFPGVMQRTLAKALDQGLTSLKVAAESRCA